MLWSSTNPLLLKFRGSAYTEIFFKIVLFLSLPYFYFQYLGLCRSISLRCIFEERLHFFWKIRHIVTFLIWIFITEITYSCLFLVEFFPGWTLKFSITLIMNLAFYFSILLLLRSSNFVEGFGNCQIFFLLL